MFFFKHGVELTVRRTVIFHMLYWHFQRKPWKLLSVTQWHMWHIRGRGYFVIMQWDKSAFTAASGITLAGRRESKN